MCGLAGVHRGAQNQVDSSLLLAMAGEMRHRGPDGTGLYLDGPFGMTNTRLAIVDLAGGDQPLSEERGRYWVMQNGEIYNYVELMDELRQLGHRFTTSCDTEVIAHAYEEWGPHFLDRLNGDFAIAVWDRERQEVLLARDRFGVRPLFLAELGGDVCFASEAKALLRHPAARRELDPVGIVDTFTTWSTLPDRSAFVGIRELPPAHYAIVGRDGIVEERRWWDLQFDPVEAPEDDLVDELEAILESSTQIRLRADVPVAAYLSGGLDSSVTAALAARTVGPGLHAFGVGFSDQRFDESAAQDAIAAELGVQFHRTTVGAADIADVFPRVVELAEKPLLRTAPAPLLELAGAVQDARLKVVLTGEGADELFAGYEYMREFTDHEALHAELERTVRSLHNLNLQRCDRVTMAHAVEARVPFLDRNVIAWALRVPPAAKQGAPEKRLLRQSFEGWLPDALLWRTKAEFGDGSGARDALSRAVEAGVSDDEFAAERDAVTPALRTKEELAYYRVWREHLQGISAERTLSRFARA